MALAARVGLQLHSAGLIGRSPGPSSQSAISTAVTQVKPSHPGKGQGLFAVNQIHAASLILSDEALLSMGDGEDLPELHAKYQVLPISDQLTFEALCKAENPSRDINLAQKLTNRGYDMATVRQMVLTSSHFMSNAFNFTEQESGILDEDRRPVWRRAVFPKVARINHSCIPNAHVHYRREVGSLFVFALRDIEPGEEILISYFNITLSNEDRQERAQKWGFSCSCAACTDPSVSAGHEQLLGRVREVVATNSQILLQASEAKAKSLRGAVDNTMELVRDVWEHAWLKPQMPEMYEQLGALVTLAERVPALTPELNITKLQAFSLAVDAEESISGVESPSSRQRRNLVASIKLSNV